MIVYASALVAAVAFMSCKTAPPKNEPETPKTQARLEPVRNCAESIGQFQNGTLNKSNVIKACSNMWAETTCRNAWSTTHDDGPEEILRACAAAYCPRYPNEKICSVAPGGFDLQSDAVDWFTVWRDFNRQVLSDDLGLDETGIAGDVAVSLLMLVSQQNRWRDEEETNEPEFDVRLKSDGAFWIVTANPGAKEFQIPKQNTIDHFDPLFEFLKKSDGVRHANIATDRPLDEKTRIHLLFGLRSIGVTFIEFNKVTH